jgi:hypothetical protein
MGGNLMRLPIQRRTLGPSPSRPSVLANRNQRIARGCPIIPATPVPGRGSPPAGNFVPHQELHLLPFDLRDQHRPATLSQGLVLTMCTLAARLNVQVTVPLGFRLTIATSTLNSRMPAPRRRCGNSVGVRKLLISLVARGNHRS